MVGVFPFFDFSQASSSRQLSSLERFNEGFDAPRNSLEFPIETSQSYELIHEDIPYACQVKYNSSKVDIHPHGAPIKKLIDDEISSQSKDRHQKFNVIARLMGMEDQSLGEEQPIRPKETKDDRITRKELTKMTSTHHSSSGSNPIKLPRKERDFWKYKENIEIDKPRAREHPQEEALQKFKKDFEAWQTSKAWESSRTLQLMNGRENATDTNVFALENLHRENSSRYINTKRSSSVTKMMESRFPCSSSTLNTDIHRLTSKSQESHRKEETAQPSRNNIYSTFHQSKGKSTMSDPPRRIVILKPCTELIEDQEDSWLGSPEMFRKENDMQDFLEQVKERLNVEIQRKSTLDTANRGHKGDTVLTEHPTHSKQIAHKIAEQIKESFNKDYKSSLTRSESTRSYAGEIHKNTNNSSQLISRDTRRLLTDRMKNVVNNETHIELPLAIDERGTPHASSRQPEIFKALDYHMKKGKKVSYFEDKQSPNEVQYRDCGHNQPHYGSYNAENVSPKNLLRSYSAPVSGTTFGKLLLVDKHVMTAAHIHRKHEAPSSSGSGSLEEGNKTRKETFNIKSRVSSLRQNLLLKSKIFGRKSFSMDESAEDEFTFSNAAMNTPSVILNSGFAQENSTEVPPSPVSLCSSPFDEFCVPGYPSPVSPLDTPYTAENNSIQIYGDASSNLSTCFPECSQLELSLPTEATDKEKLTDYEIPKIAEDAEAFLRDILVTSGLFEGQAFGQILSGFDTTIKPISRWVFDEVEEIYAKLGKEDHRQQLLCPDHVNISSKMLFDLLNEALLKVIRTPRPCSTLKRVPHGNELLHKMWWQIQALCKSPMNCLHPLESIVAHDLNKTPWSSVFYEDIDVIGMDMEVLLFQDLIDELVHDLGCR